MASHSDLKTASPRLTFEQLLGRVCQLLQADTSNFSVEASNKPIIAALLAYFSKNSTECQKRGISLQKGLFLSGPVGCGKTSLMRWFARAQPRPRFLLVSARKVARQFLEDGYAVIDKYGYQSFRSKHTGFGRQLLYDQPLTYCFDDLGLEPEHRRFGNDCNVMAEIILDRYEQMKQYGMITHMTTNLNAEELEDHYGPRVRSRFKEMFNLLSFPMSAPDRRVPNHRALGKQERQFTKPN
jgi:hypothetical protein